VLYCHKDQTWKIGDFGLSVEGTSRRARETVEAKGTASYRAPELLLESGYTFTNKVDIWALGCISYELVTRRKAFFGDVEVLQYALEQRKPRLTLAEPESRWQQLPMRSTIGLDEQSKRAVSSFIEAMMQLEPRDRPSSLVLLSALRNQRFRKVKSEHVWVNECWHTINSPGRLNAPDLVYLPPESPLWRLVTWRRHW